MRHVFVPEVVHRGENGVRGSLPQCAQGGVPDDAREVLEFREVLLGAFAFGYPVEYLQQAFVSDATRGALAAGLLDGEFEIEFGHRDHAVVLVHHYHAARTHHGTAGEQVVVIDGGVEVLLGEAAA